MTNTVEVVGGWQTQTTHETRPYGVDLTDALDLADAPVSATAELIDLLTGLAHPTGLSGAATTSITAPHVTQTVTGLVAGRNYRLSLTVNVGGSKRSDSVVLIRVPY